MSVFAEADASASVDPIVKKSADRGRELLVIHQDPKSRKFSAIGLLRMRDDGKYAFTYLPWVSPEELLRSMPTRRDVVAEALPAFFATRVMDPKQPGFDDWVKAYELSAPISPMEILARTAGERMTDTYQVVEVLRLDERGKAHGYFMVSGFRYVPDPAVADRLSPGQRLDLVPEPTNPVNPEAIQLEADGHCVGWVPDWLLFTVRAVNEAGGDVEVSVVKVNPPESGMHLRVFASIQVQAPLGTQLYEWAV